MTIAFKAFSGSGSKDLNKYKFLFRNDIFSSTKNDKNKDETGYQLAPVMRGYAYRPYYVYFSERKQYLVCSRLEPSSLRRYDAYAPPHKEEIIRHVLLDSKGQIVQRLDTKFKYSINTGMFFTQSFYMNWLETGDTTKLPYAGIYNKDIKMNSIQFADKFRELYAKADYIEYVEMSRLRGDSIGNSVVFKIKQEWYILLNGWNSSHIYAGNLKEDKRTGVDSYTYTLKFDYYDPDRKRKNPYPQSLPLVKNVYLETNDPTPYRFNKMDKHDGLKLAKYKKLSSTGWQGVAEIKGIPIFVPGTGEGVAYMEYKIGKETIHFKIPDVTKYDFRSVYNLGVRSFKIPAALQFKESLVFIESMQNFAHYHRVGGGIYVIKPRTSTKSNTSVLPKGISEDRYASLPLSLQVALVDVEGTSELKTKGWYPEIKLFSNLKYLKITGGLDVFPEGISVFKKLEVLILKNCGMPSVSDELAELKHLKILNLYSNHLTSFPLIICQLEGLTHLDVGGGNDIREIPSCISNLSKLRELNLLFLGNIQLPETVDKMKGLIINRDEKLKEGAPVEKIVVKPF